MVPFSRLIPGCAFPSLDTLRHPSTPFDKLRTRAQDKSSGQAGEAPLMAIGRSPELPEGGQGAFPAAARSSRDSWCHLLGIADRQRARKGAAAKCATASSGTGPKRITLSKKQRFLIDCTVFPFNACRHLLISLPRHPSTSSGQAGKANAQGALPTSNYNSK